MSGRGKGGKGLGKGGTKRHRKVLRDNIQGITKPALRRLARRGGVKRISGLIPEEMRSVLKVFLENVIRDSVTMTEHARRKTVAVVDVLYTLKRQGRPLWGVTDGPKRLSAEALEQRRSKQSVPVPGEAGLRSQLKLSPLLWYSLPLKYSSETTEKQVQVGSVPGMLPVLLHFPEFTGNICISTGGNFVLKVLDVEGQLKAKALDLALSYVDLAPAGLVPFKSDAAFQIDLMPALTPAYGNMTPDLFRKVIDVVNGLRAQSILYFDLKLSNILLDGNEAIMGDVEEAYPEVRLLAHIYWACNKANKTICKKLITDLQVGHATTTDELLAATENGDFLNFVVTHSPANIETLLKPLKKSGLVVGKREPSGGILLSFETVTNVPNALLAIRQAHALLTQWALAMTALECMFDTEAEYDTWADENVNMLTSNQDLKVKKRGKQDWIEEAQEVYESCFQQTVDKFADNFHFG